MRQTHLTQQRLYRKVNLCLIIKRIKIILFVSVPMK